MEATGIGQVQRARRVYGRDFKLQIVRRVTQGMGSAELARDFNISPIMVARWLREWHNDPADAFRGCGRRRLSQRRVERLHREIKRLRAERDFLKESLGPLCTVAGYAYSFISEHRAQWPVRWMCEVLGVSHSGYYAWLKRSSGS